MVPLEKVEDELQQVLKTTEKIVAVTGCRFNLSKYVDHGFPDIKSK